MPAPHLGHGRKLQKQQMSTVSTDSCLSSDVTIMLSESLRSQSLIMLAVELLYTLIFSLLWVCV